MRLLASGLLLAILPTVAGCSGDSSGGTPTFAPTAPAGSAPNRIADGCSLLTPAEVGKALGLKDVRVGLLPDTMGTAIAQCEYRGTNGYVDLFVADEPATITPEQAIRRVIGDSLGTRESIADVGDAAIYVNDTVDRQQTVVAVKTMDSQLRVITALAYLQSEAKEPLISIVNTVTERV
jgi:hypothetical protein